MCLETPDHFPAPADNAYVSIVATEEQALRARAHAGYLVILEDRSRLVVAELDLADIEEVECFPLRGITVSPNTSLAGDMPSAIRRKNLPKAKP
jgi:hypothetical protein